MALFKHDEKQFLESYCKFTVNVRPYIIKKLCDDYKKADTEEEKNFLHLLALEQWFLLYEALEGFFRAIKDRKIRPVFESLNKDLNIKNLYGSLRNKSVEKILEDLSVNLSVFPKDKQKIIRNRLIRLVGLWKEENIYKVMKAIVPVFYRMKHKLLFYLKDEKLACVLDEIQEKESENLLKNIPNTTDKLSDIDCLFEMAKRFKATIQDLIAIRLLELQ